MIQFVLRSILCLQYTENKKYRTLCETPKLCDSVLKENNQSPVCILLTQRHGGTEVHGVRGGLLVHAH